MNIIGLFIFQGTTMGNQEILERLKKQLHPPPKIRGSPAGTLDNII